MKQPSAHRRALLEDHCRKYSVGKAFRHLMAGEQLDGLEAEVQDEIGGDALTNPAQRFFSGITIPWAALAQQRDLNVSTPSAGGHLVGLQMGPAADVLRPYSVAARAGMSVLSDLNSDVDIPSMFDEVDFQWLIDENSPGPSLTPAIGLAQMRPHVACGLITFPDRLVRLAPPGMVDLFVRRRLLLAAGQLIDRMVLDGRKNYGSPTADDMAEPLGLCNITGVQRFSASGSATDYTIVTEGVNPAMSYVLTHCGSDDGAAFIVSPFMREALLPGGVLTMSAMSPDGKLQTRPAHATSAMRANALAYGHWSNAVLGLWGRGIDVALDPYTGFRTNTITMRCIVSMDVAFPAPQSFAIVERTA